MLLDRRNHFPYWSDKAVVMQNQSNADARFHVQLDQSGFVTVEIGKESFGLSGLRRYSEFYNYLYKQCLHFQNCPIP